MPFKENLESSEVERRSRNHLEPFTPVPTPAIVVLKQSWNRVVDAGSRSAFITSTREAIAMRSPSLVAYLEKISAEFLPDSNLPPSLPTLKACNPISKGVVIIVRAGIHPFATV